jgi:hypothetical protein
MVRTFLFTVHGHVRPIGGNGRRGEGLRGSPPCQRAPHVPRARQKYAKGSGAPVLTLQGLSEAEIVLDRAEGSGALMTSWGLGRGGNCRPSRLSRPRPFRKARAGRRLGFGFERLTRRQRL